MRAYHYPEGFTRLTLPTAVWVMGSGMDVYRAHSLFKYWDEVGTKFDACGTTFIENSTKYNPEVINYRPLMTKHTPRWREAPPGGVFAYLWSPFDHFGIVFRRNFDKFRTAIVKLRTNFVPIIANIMTKKVPIIFHIRFVGMGRSSCSSTSLAPCPNLPRSKLPGSRSMGHCKGCPRTHRQRSH